MSNRPIYLGNNILKSSGEDVDGGFVEIQHEKFYKISNYNRMADFFMTIVSYSDHWMFLSSNGSLSAGRKNRNIALFPYYTVDKIHDFKGLTGSKTLILVERQDKKILWQPFTDVSEKVYNITRNLYKSIYGNKIIFEEINDDLGLSFRYGWYNSEKFGFVRKSVLSNLSDQAMKTEVLDGIGNILPSGVDSAFQNEYSNLLDAYKKNELLDQSRLGLFMLSSVPIDRAEPSEALKATTVWSCGLNIDSKILISDTQLSRFMNGLPLENETDIRARRGAFYVNASMELEKGSSIDWMMVAEVNQDSTKVANLDSLIKSGKNLSEQVNRDIEEGTRNLIKIVGSADGLQISNEELGCARHFSNSLYNIMRGGIFADNYTIDKTDFGKFLRNSNSTVFKKFEKWIGQLPEKIKSNELIRLAGLQGNTDLERLSLEYLPLTFSRRHGDPSRPWNQFSIETKNDDGSAKLYYAGNWRDIFQNWEALGLSYPEFIEGMITKFLDATTSDGYNPYRITSDGIDWEAPDPHDPWAYIGYWGDHQIIYLQKLLELSDKFHPGKLDELMLREIFAFANVPYRIKEFEEIVKNPQDTIGFDFELNKKIKSAIESGGSDECLLKDSSDNVYHVNLIEKILVTLLAKLSNFIPEAGIWLNTQRPEWNDANNALVGNGASMVTLNYLRRFLKFWEEKFNASSMESVIISEEVKTHFDKVFALFSANQNLIESNFSDAGRLGFATSLGKAGSEYRMSIYKNSFSGRKKSILLTEMAEFIALSMKYTEHSIRANKRNDGLYHAYNLITFSKDGISIRYLYPMLEGQVAALSSGYLDASESLDVLNALKSSSLFREDQYSYLLYPDRQLPRFTEKNNLDQAQVDDSDLLTRLIKDNNSAIITKDVNGVYHFNSDFRNAGMLKEALCKFKGDHYKSLVEKEEQKILGIFEEIFDHQSFTGRSGAFYGYEGLGCIYWHMVSKLLLAAEESYYRGIAENAGAGILGKIKDHYYEIKAGIGLYKSPSLYGAFPTDAYSHTPGNAGVQQPGMTGQVKEDLISRLGELGLHIEKGEVVFNTSLISKNEFLKEKAEFEYYNTKGEKEQISLYKDQLAFTFCQVPVIYSISGENHVVITFENGEKKSFGGNTIPSEVSHEIFSRTGKIKCVIFFTANL